MEDVKCKMENGGKNITEEKCMAFAVKIVKLKKHLNKNMREYNMADQVQRSGTAIGALYGESQYAESDADFIHKIRIALKENHETRYWLELLYKTEYITEAEFQELYSEAVEIQRILTAIVNKKNANTGK